MVGEEVAKALEYWMNAGPENIEIPKEEFEDKNFKALLNEIRELRKEVASLKVLQIPKEIPIEKTKVVHNSNFELPSFLKDNPWVEILSSKKYYENGQMLRSMIVPKQADIADVTSVTMGCLTSIPYFLNKIPNKISNNIEINLII